MKLLVLSAVCVVLVSACGGSGQTGDDVSAPDPTTTSRKQASYSNPTAGSALVLQIPGMHEAEVRRDIRYGEGPAERLMDVYYPRASERSDPLPAVLLGGPPEFGAGKDSGQKVGWAQLIAASGMVAIAFDIRSDNILATPQDPSRDVAAAIAYVRDHSADLGIDGDRLCTLGFSFGTAPWHLWATMREPAPHIRCNAVYYGPLDFYSEPLMDAELAKEYSALTYLRRYGADIPPMLIAKAGREENPGINESIDRFVEEAERIGADIRLLTHPEGPHGFDLETDDDQSREIIKATLQFFQDRLAPG